jgi:hypothetical protein
MSMSNKKDRSSSVPSALDEESFHKDFEGIDFGTSILWAD